MIQAEKLGLRLRGRVVLEDITFSVVPGVPTAVLGRNGSGKSLLLSLLAGEYHPTWGSAKVAEWDLSRQRRRVARSVGYVGEPLGRSFRLRVEEYLSAFAAAYRVPRKARKQVIAEVLALFDLEPFRERPIRLLSRGEVQRLELARALLHDPPVLLLDEPLVGLDPPRQAETLEILRELRELGKTLLLATNLPELYEDFFAQGLLLERGGLLAQGTPEELLRRLRSRADNQTTSTTTGGVS